MTPEERFNKYQRLAFFSLRLIWPDQGSQLRSALKHGMEYEDFDQIALAELWRCCLQHDEGQGEKAFRGFVIKSVRFAVMDVFRRKGSLIKYPDEMKDRAKIEYFESQAPENSGGSEEVDFHSMLPADTNVERQVLLKLSLEEKLSILNPHERLVICCKLAGESQKEIEKKGYSVPRQDYFVRKAYDKLGIKRDRSGRKDLFISLYNAGKSQDEIMRAMQIDKWSYGSYRKTYRDQLKERVSVC